LKNAGIFGQLALIKDNLMAALRKFISLPEAAKKIHASINDLRPLIEKGKIKAATINGEIFVDALTLPKKIVKKQDVPEYKRFEKFQGVAISIGQAARDYNIPQPTISGWKKRGLLKQVGVEKNRILIDKQDVAYCAYIYHKNEQGKRQGQWLFDLNGVPRSN
jgi:hypothetical protein